MPEEPISRDEAERQQHLEFMRTVTAPHHRRHRWARPVAMIVVVLLLVIAGIGAYGHFAHHKTPASQAAKTRSQTAKHSTQPSTTPKVPSQSYTSPDFNLSFNYPDGWKVVDSGSGPMTVTSPAVQLTSATGKTVTGLITMTIQKQGQIPASFSAGTALAVLNSQTVIYTQPTMDQTSQAYLTFVQYASTTTRGGLDALYLTGNDGYQKDQIIPDTDIAGIDPLVVVSFTQCGNSSCTSNLTPLTIASTSWSKATLQAPIMTMLTSLAFQ